MTLLRTALLALLGLALTPPALAEPYNLGDKVCEECHEAEVRVWKGTEHYKGYKMLHRTDEAKRLGEAVGDEDSAKRNPVCTECHYTMIPRKPGSTPRARAGPSCESCHGPASEWKDIHSDFGPFESAADESAEHRSQRLAAAREAGMIYSSMHYDIAANCMGCHGLASPDVAAADLAGLLAADHPFEPGFELVKYSQGTVRHRFYRPQVSVNQEMSREQLARFFVTGQAAQLVSAAAAAQRASDPAYRAAQQKRADAAKQALAGVRDLPEAAALIADPSAAKARALVAAIASRDLSGALGSMLPPKSSYK